jgi:3-deoxy-D-manno-octulosonic-acid transferase
MRQLYTLILTIIAPFYLFILTKKNRKHPVAHGRWKEYLGICSKTTWASDPIWIHSVSVGETIGVLPLVKALQKTNPDVPILMTTTTGTGAQIIKDQITGKVFHHFMPFDLPICINYFLDIISPSQLIIMETELWPNTLLATAKRNIPITVINARLSEKSKSNYKKLGNFFRSTINHIDHLLCQHQQDASRFLELGIEKHKVQVTGSLKFDIQVPQEQRSKGEQIRSQYPIRPCWIAASTHEVEDEIILVTHQKVLKKVPDALLILVPRHPERFNDIFKKSEVIFNTIRRSSGERITPTTQLYLADTMGEMLALLTASDVSFIGGSLIGDKVGGHNPLEPAAIGMPIITGPSIYNFKEIYHTLFELGVAIQKNDAQSIAEQVIQFLTEPTLTTSIQVKAQNFVNSNRGALDITIATILNIRNLAKKVEKS